MDLCDEVRWQVVRMKVVVLFWGGCLAEEGVNQLGGGGREGGRRTVSSSTFQFRPVENRISIKQARVVFASALDEDEPRRVPYWMREPLMEIDPSLKSDSFSNRVGEICRS